MEEDAPAPQQGGRADTVVISRTEYELLSGVHQRLEKLEERFTTIEAQSATYTTLLREILGRLPAAAGASSSIPPGEQQ
jgi:chaperonin cofactor prefoldin